MEEFEILPLALLSRGRFHDAGGRRLEGDVKEVVKAAAGGKALYVIDADGVAANRPNLDVIKRASRHAELWVDAGPRFSDDAMDIFVAGADRVTVRSSMVRGEEELRELAELSDASFLGVEYDPRLRPNPEWRDLSESVVRRLSEELGLGVVVIDVASGSGNGQIARPIVGAWEGFGGRKFALGGKVDERVESDLRTLGFAGAIGSRRP